MGNRTREPRTGQVGAVLLFAPADGTEFRERQGVSPKMEGRPGVCSAGTDLCCPAFPSGAPLP